jgi:hypothetical protein
MDTGRERLDTATEAMDMGRGRLDTSGEINGHNVKKTASIN